MADNNSSIRYVKTPDNRFKMTPEYSAYHAMKSRCLNDRHKAFARYGGRGIVICDRWLESFDNFFADMGKRLGDEYSLDRYPDNDGNYEPSNCRWATRDQQASNMSTNHPLTFNGKTLTVTEWSRVLGVTDTVLFGRLKMGWTLERALTESINVGTLAQNARDAGFPVSTVQHRVDRGWSVERALTLPKQKSGQFLYSDDEITAIKQYRANGHTLRETAKHFGCSNSHVSRVVNGKRRKH